MTKTDSLIESVNLAVRFSLELCAVAAVGLLGFKFGGSIGAGVLLGGVATFLVALVWGAFISTGALRKLEDPSRLALELAVFTAAAAGLMTSLSAFLAVVFMFVVFLNLTFMFLLYQR